MHALEVILAAVSSFIWGWPLLVLLGGAHVFFTFRLRGLVQRHTWTAIKLSVQRDPGEGDVSQFGALTTALASTIGAGNIVGVATAVAAGGPGAVFWLWLTGVFGMATKYAEGVLAMRYRVKRDTGEFAGGPMYVLERALGWRWLAVAFAVFTLFAGFGMANMVQSNALVTMTQAGLPGVAPGTIALIGGVVLAVGTAAIMLGGIQSISRWSNAIVPAMSVLYILTTLAILVLHAERLPATLATILRGAFSGQAAVGGFAGATVAAALRFGIARGLFSNESGLGSAPIAAAAARTTDPVRQGLVSATGTFWDTVVVCALTGLVVVNSGAWETGLKGAELARAAFAGLGAWAQWGLNVSLALFVFTSIYGWAYYVEKAVEYLWGRRAILPFRWIWIAVVFVGANLSAKAVWDFADIANGLMAVPNLIALFALHREIAAETKRYFSRPPSAV